MKRLATTLEQSRRLIQLGLDRATCDFAYCGEDGPFVFTGDWHDLDENGKEGDAAMTPAWSMGALLALLPAGTLFMSSSRYGWHVDYASERISYDAEERNLLAIDAVYELVVWLLENGYIRGKEAAV